MAFRWMRCRRADSQYREIRLFFASLWLLSGIVFVMVLFYEDSAKQFNTYDDARTRLRGKKQPWRSESPEWREKKTSSGRSADMADVEVHKWRLTKSEYPVALTVPFLIKNEQICDGDVTVLIIVHTAILHFERRIQLRMTIGNTKLFKSKYNIRVAFLMGTTTQKTNAMLVNQENKRFGDIVQADFHDTYRNLTNKGVMGLRWVTQYCPHAAMVLKIDDDIFVNIFQIIGYYLPLHRMRKNALVCNTVFPGKILRSRSRWAVQNDEFMGRKYYPRYCSGFTVLMGTDTVRAFYRAAHITPTFWVDDVYLFGLLPNTAKITHRVLNHNVSLFRDKCDESYQTENPYLVACTASQTDVFMYYWERSVKTLRPPIKELVNGDVIAKSLNSTRYKWHSLRKTEKKNFNKQKI